MEQDIIKGGEGFYQNEIHRFDSFSIATDGIFIVDREKKITSFSERVERITGYSFHEIAGKKCREVFDTDLCDKRCLVEDTIKKGNVYTNIFVNIHKKDRTTTLISKTITPLKDIKGKIVGAIVTFRDMAEIDSFLDEIRKKEDELFQERSRFEAIVEHLDEGVFSIDTLWRITSFNRKAELITGYSKEEVIGKECRSVIKSDQCESDCMLEKALYLKEALTGMYVDIRTRDGEIRTVLMKTIPFYNREKKFSGGVETIREISSEDQISPYIPHLKSRKQRLEAMEEFERGLILHCLEENNWNQQMTAKKLGISPVTLWRKMKRYGIQK
jgi:PAS domain S-box-containing protein